VLKKTIYVKKIYKIYHIFCSVFYNDTYYIELISNAHLRTIHHAIKSNVTLSVQKHEIYPIPT